MRNITNIIDKNIIDAAVVARENESLTPLWDIAKDNNDTDLAVAVTAAIKLQKHGDGMKALLAYVAAAHGFYLRDTIDNALFLYYLQKTAPKPISPAFVATGVLVDEDKKGGDCGLPYSLLDLFDGDKEATNEAVREKVADTLETLKSLPSVATYFEAISKIN